MYVCLCYLYDIAGANKKYRYFGLFAAEDSISHKLKLSVLKKKKPLRMEAQMALKIPNHNHKSNCDCSSGLTLAFDFLPKRYALTFISACESALFIK